VLGCWGSLARRPHCYNALRELGNRRPFDMGALFEVTRWPVRVYWECDASPTHDQPAAAWMPGGRVCNEPGLITDLIRR
jgi:hypothetical protein